jgi:hypothetical protein
VVAVEQDAVAAEDVAGHRAHPPGRLRGCELRAE